MWLATEVSRLKEMEGPDLITYGHGQLGQTLLKLGLLDALEVSSYPIVVGHGKLFFREGESARLKLAAAAGALNSDSTRPENAARRPMQTRPL